MTSTHLQAQSLAIDLIPFLGNDSVELLPAWETLPFERVSPAIETMGHRCRVQTRLVSNDKPKIVVCSVRAAMQKISTSLLRTKIQINKGSEIDRDILIEQLVSSGYSREFQVEARGECAVRGSIVDVFPSTSSHPIRVEFWGDEVERMSYFSLADQRSTNVCELVEIYPARELVINKEIKETAAQMAVEHLWAQQQFDSISEGLIFDGMESFLPFLTNDN